MNENVIVKEYEFVEPLIQKINSIIDNCIRACHKKHFHIFDHICEHDINFSNIPNKETVNFTLSDKNMSLYELNELLKSARENGFVFNHINNNKIIVYSNLSNLNTQYHLKHRVPIRQRLLFKILSQNLEYVQTFRNDRKNPFQFACRRLSLYNNPQC